MPSLFQALKDTKRRVKQKFRVATGLSRLTTNEEFNSTYREYCDLKKNLSCLLSQCKLLIKNVESWSEINYKLSKEMNSYISTTASYKTEDLEDYRHNVVELHDSFRHEYDVTRRAIVLVLKRRIVDRLEKLLKDCFEGFDSVYKVRQNIIFDYDSHMQRYDVYNHKNDIKQRERFLHKAEHDKAMIKTHTQFLMARYAPLLTLGSHILMSETATLLSCEMYLVKRQYEALTDICNNYGDTLISSIVDDIENVISGIEKGDNVEKTYVCPVYVLPVFSDDAPKYIPFNEYEKKESIGDDEKGKVNTNSALGTADEENRAEMTREASYEHNETKQNRRKILREDVFDSDVEEEERRTVYRDVEEREEKDSYDDTKKRSSTPKESTYSGDWNLWNATTVANQSIPSYIDEKNSIYGSVNRRMKNEAISKSYMNNKETVDDMEMRRSNSYSKTFANEERDKKEESSDSTEYEYEYEYDEDEEEENPKVVFVIAQYNFRGDEEGDLPFKKGSRIRLLQKDKSGWWTGEFKGVTGIFPANYVVYEKE